MDHPQSTKTTIQAERRKYLNSLLKALPYVKQVWFQPPENIKLEYPCIIYNWERVKDISADNMHYSSRRGYKVTIIDYNPDSVIPDLFHRNFPTASFDRSYVADGLNHWVYTLFF